MANIAIAALMCVLVATASSRVALDETELLQASVDVHAVREAGTLVADKTLSQGGSDPCHVLLFFSVGKNPTSKKLVPRNVDHFRATGGLSADLYLAHYTSDRNEWKNELGEWYDHNVDFSAELKGLKLWLAKDLLLPRPMGKQDESLPKVDIHNYEYLWILDEDAHFFHTDLAKMFSLARESQASIMTPAFTTTLPEEGIDFDFVEGRKSRMFSSLNCQPTESPCKLQAPDPHCSFRYTNFVECIFTMMRPRTFEEVVGGCNECLPNRTSTWGLDKVWCSYASEKDRKPAEKTCAILDATPIIHANTMSHPKYQHGDADWKAYNQQFLDAVQAALPQYFKWPPVTHKCEA